MKNLKSFALLASLFVGAASLAASSRYLDGQFIRVGTSGTLTLPAATDTLVGKATTDTLTNKTMSGASNTFTNIPNSATTATAANTASAIMARDGSGQVAATTFTGALVGTADNATTATTATNATNGATVSTSTNASFFPLFSSSSANGNHPFNLGTGLTFNPSTNTLSTTTFAGALAGTASGNTTYTANNHGVVVAGSGNAMTVIAPDASTTKVLTSGGSSADPTWQSVASAPQSSYDVQNVGLAATVSANALTIALKQSNGSDCSSGSAACLISFRNSTLTTGQYTQRTVTAALSTTISAGSTGGSVSGSLISIYAYAIDNAGTPELAWAGSRIVDEGTLVSTTAEGGLGAADSRNVLYSTTARTNVPVRWLGRLKLVEPTAGTWTAAPVEIALLPIENNIPQSYVLVEGTAATAHGSVATKSIIGSAVTTVGGDIVRGTSAAGGDLFTIMTDGVYCGTIMAKDTAGTAAFGVTVDSTELTTNINAVTTTASVLTLQDITTATNRAQGSFCRYFNTGAILRMHDDGGIDGSLTALNFRFLLSRVR